MPELRKDLVTREWVIIAPERADRGGDFPWSAVEPPTAKDGASCPFDRGREGETPQEIAAYRPAGTGPNTPGWWVRVVPNKFPALTGEGEVSVRSVNLYEAMTGIGAHEVIIETAEHQASLARLELKQVEEVVWMYRDRYLDLSRDRRFQYILVFRNHRRGAGSSMAHAHSQLIATPVVPVAVRHEVEGLRQYAEYHNRCCAYCDMVAAEVASGERVVAQNKEFIALEPFASRFPFETWVFPRRHTPHFAALTPEEVKDLAAILRETLLRIDVGLGDPPYNYFIHSVPLNMERELAANFHWHLELIPRLTVAAGFELGTVMYINIMPPERAAQRLRQVDLGSLLGAEGKK